MGWDEDRLHRWLARRPAARVVAGSPMHDAMVLRPLRGRTVACVDQTIEGVHAQADVAPARFGAKAAGRALSDLAATAASPRALLLALRAPAERDERWMRGVIGGVARAAERAGAELVGGARAAAPGRASATVTAFGAFMGTRRPPGRDRARPGQVVVLTGPVGGSVLGRHLAIEPRFEASRRLFAARASALMDVSDGLALDLWRLARASGVRIELDLARVPVHRDARRLARSSGRPALWHALHDGEDHELVATLPRVAAAAAERAGDVVVGRVLRGEGLVLRERDGRALPWSGDGGWIHGR